MLWEGRGLITQPFFFGCATFFFFFSKKCFFSMYINQCVSIKQKSTETETNGARHRSKLVTFYNKKNGLLETSFVSVD